MILRSQLLVLASLLTGCSSCHVASYYKPTPDSRKYVQTYTQLPGYAGLKLGDQASAMIAFCGDKYLPAPGSAVQLCISVELANNSTMRFLDGKVQLTAGAMKPAMVEIASIEYEVWCNVQAGTRICSSSEESPVDGPRTKRPGMHAGLDRYLFEPLLAFRGANDTLHEGAIFGQRLIGKRSYLVKTAPIAIGKGTHLVVEFPDVLIDGQTVELPRLEFQAVTEEVCRMRPLA